MQLLNSQSGQNVPHPFLQSIIFLPIISAKQVPSASSYLILDNTATSIHTLRHSQITTLVLRS